jgi:hypothetical protein
MAARLIVLASLGLLGWHRVETPRYSAAPMPVWQQFVEVTSISNFHTSKLPRSIARSGSDYEHRADFSGMD